MIKGLHTAALGMIPKTVKIDVIANNLANVNTSGYKKSNLFVRELIKADIAGKKEGLSDPVSKIPQKFDIDFSQGRLDETKNPLDLAINGEGFFVIETDKGIRYSRNGHLTLSDEGKLITSDGYSVLGEGGEIFIPDPQRTQQNQITVSKKGELFIGKRLIDKLQVVNFPQDDGSAPPLQYAGNNLLVAPSEYSHETVEPAKFDIHQGYLEGSNVDALAEMVRMMELNSAIQIDQKVIRYQDNSLQQTNEIGRI